MSSSSPEAVEYAKFLAKSSGLTWTDLWELYHEASLTSAESLVLIHPRWYSSVISLDEMLGKHPFGVSAGAEETCGSEVIFGYECPFVDDPLEADHVFPRSLGGPTVSGNSIWLCKSHNRWKGSDYRYESFGQELPEWFPSHLDRVARYLA